MTLDQDLRAIRRVALALALLALWLSGAGAGWYARAAHVPPTTEDPR